MGQTLLLAESCDLLRIGLRTIFAKDPCVSHTHEAVTSSHLEMQLRSPTVAPVVVNQALGINILRLLAENFATLPSKLEMHSSALLPLGDGPLRQFTHERLFFQAFLPFSLDSEVLPANAYILL